MTITPKDLACGKRLMRLVGRGCSDDTGISNPTPAYRDSSWAGIPAMPPASEVSVDVPAAAQAGDVVFAAVVMDLDGAHTPTVVPPAENWFSAHDRTTAGTDFRVAVYWHVLTLDETAPGTTFTWKLTGDGNEIAFLVALVAYRDVDPYEPVQDTASATGTAATAIAANQVRTKCANTRLLLFAATTHLSVTFAPDAAMTSRLAVAPGPALSVEDQEINPPGLTGTRTATASAPGTVIGILIAVNPVKKDVYAYSDRPTGTTGTGLMVGRKIDVGISSFYFEEPIIDADVYAVADQPCPPPQCSGLPFKDFHLARRVDGPDSAKQGVTKYATADPCCIPCCEPQILLPDTVFLSYGGVTWGSAAGYTWTLPASIAMHHQKCPVSALTTAPPGTGDHGCGPCHPPPCVDHAWVSDCYESDEDLPNNPKGAALLQFILTCSKNPSEYEWVLHLGQGGDTCCDSFAVGKLSCKPFHLQSDPGSSPGAIICARIAQNGGCGPCVEDAFGQCFGYQVGDMQGPIDITGDN